MANLGDFTISMKLLTTKFNANAKNATNSLKAIESRANAVGSALAGVAAAAGAVGLAAMVRNAIEANSALYDMSIRLGATTEGLSRLSYAAEQTGVSQETLFMALQRSTRRISEAAQGTGEAVKALDELGLSAKKLVDLKPEDQFKALADAIEGVKNPADKVRLAMKLFDSEGVKLIQTMQGGSEALKAYADESDKFGTTVAQSTASAAKKAGDAFTRMAAAGTGLANQLVISLAPTLTELAEWFAKHVPSAVAATLKSFKLAAAGAYIVAEEISNGLASFYDILAKIPGSFGKTYANAAESVRSFSGEMSAEAESWFESIENAGKAFDEKFIPAVGRARYSLDSLMLEDGASNITSTVAKKKIDEAKRIADEQRKIERQKEKDLIAFNNRRAEISQIETDLMSPLDRLKEQQAARLQIVENANNELIISEAKYLRLKAELNKKSAEEQKQLLASQKSVALQQYGTLFGDIASLSEGFADNQSEIYKSMFAVSKAFAIADSIVKIQNGLASAAALTFPANLAAMGAVASQTASIVSNIQAVNFGGARAKGGPVTGGMTYLVGEKGPELFTPKSSGSITANDKLGGGVNVTIIEDKSRAGRVEKDGADVRVYVAAALAELNKQISSGNGVANSLERRYGLQRRAS